MTDDTTRFPGSGPDDTEMETETDRVRREEAMRAPSRPGSDDEEPNPLMRDGPDAPDAADIEDPSEQL